MLKDEEVVFMAKTNQLSNIKAQEFIFQNGDEVHTIHDGKLHYCSKSDLTTALLKMTGEKSFDQIEKTKNHSYTFVPKKDELNSKQTMPIRVYLDKTDLKKYNPNGNEEFFENLRLTCQAQKRVQNIKNLVIGVGAAATIAALSIAGTFGFLNALDKEMDIQSNENKEYFQYYEDAKKQEALENYMDNERKESQQSQEELRDAIVSGWEQEENQIHK